MTKYFSGNCSAATEYYRASGTYWTSTTNDPDAAPLPIFKSIDNRIDSLNTSYSSIVAYPGSSTTFDEIRIYSQTHQSDPEGGGLWSQYLGGHQITYFEMQDDRYWAEWETPHAFDSVPLDQQIDRSDDWFGPSKCDSDGQRLVITTQAVEGATHALIVVNLRDSYYQTSLRQADSSLYMTTNLKENLSEALSTHYHAQDVKYHDGYWYILFCMTSGTGALNSHLVKAKRDTFEIIESNFIINISSPIAMTFGPDNFLYIADRQSPTKIACIYDLVTLDYALTTLKAYCNSAIAMFNDGYSANVLLQHCSNSYVPAGWTTIPKGYYALGYNPEDDAWHPSFYTANYAVFFNDSSIADVFDIIPFRDKCLFSFQNGSNHMVGWYNPLEVLSDDFQVANPLDDYQYVDTTYGSDEFTKSKLLAVENSCFLVGLTTETGSAGAVVEKYQMLLNYTASEGFPVFWSWKHSTLPVYNLSHSVIGDMIYTARSVVIVYNGSEHPGTPAGFSKDPISGR